jgi:hypothetical protein
MRLCGTALVGDVLIAKQHERTLVVGRELIAALLFGHMQIPERLTGDKHRDPKEALLRGMAGGKPLRPRMLTEIRSTQRRRIADQLSKHAVARRRRPDLTAC